MLDSYTQEKLKLGYRTCLGVLRHSLGFVFHGFTFYTKLHKEERIRILELPSFESRQSIVVISENFPIFFFHELCSCDGKAWIFHYYQLNVKH